MTDGSLSREGTAIAALPFCIEAAPLISGLHPPALETLSEKAGYCSRAGALTSEPFGARGKAEGACLLAVTGKIFLAASSVSGLLFLLPWRRTSLLAAEPWPDVLLDE